MKKLKHIILVLIFSSCQNAPDRKNDISVVHENSLKSQKQSLQSDKSLQSKNSSNQDSAKHKILLQLIQSSNLAALKDESYKLLLDDPKDILALNALGIYYYRINQLQAAELIFSKALNLTPDSHFVLNNLGVLKYRQDQHLESYNYFQSALKITSKNEITIQNLKNYYLKHLDFENAVKYSTSSNYLRSDELDIQCQFAIALMSVGQFDQSKIIFQKILNINPDHILALINLAILEIDKNQKYKEGLDLINRLKLVRTVKETETVIKTLENQALAGLKLYERTK